MLMCPKKSRITLLANVRPFGLKKTFISLLKNIHIKKKMVTLKIENSSKN